MIAAQALTDAQRLDWLRLSRSENVGPRTFQKLIDRFGDAGRALAALPDIARRIGAPRDIKLCSLADAEAEWERARRLGVRFLARCEPDYPAPLRVIDAPPPLIAVQGRAEALLRPIISVVGSRNASASGLVFTERLVRALGAGGYVVASGLARGIDAKAHLASLDTGTVAVLAGGHDRIYPSEHEPLARRILERGAVISEMPLGWEPRARDFPRRNRIVAGLCLGVVVVEASRRSGSLITARFANEQGRDVFAVPGSPLDPRAEGTNDLLRQGATICTSGDDVIAALAAARGEGGIRKALAERAERDLDADLFWDEVDLVATAADGPGHDPRADPDAGSDDAADGFERTAGPAFQASDAARLLDLIGPTPIAVDDLIRVSGLSPRYLQAALVELEMLGRVLRHDGNRVATALPRDGASGWDRMT